MCKFLLFIVMKKLVTTATFLDTRRKKSNERYPIKIRITFQRVRKYYNTGYDATEGEFLMINSNKTKNELMEIKKHVFDEQLKIDNIIERMGDFNFQKFDSIYFKPNIISKEDVFDYFKNKIEESKTINLNTSINYSCAMNSLKEFAPKLSFYDITPAFLRKYEEWMLTTKMNSISTIGFYLRPLRHIINKAIEDGIIDREFYPFGIKKYIIPSSRNLKKALSKEDIKKIYLFKPIEGSTKDKALDFWKLSYLCNGMNIKDICNLKWNNFNEDRIHFIRGKTKNSIRTEIQEISILITDDIRKIINKWANEDKRKNKYIFPILNDKLTDDQAHKKIQGFTKQINTYMNKIAKELKINSKVTTYVARHSFSTMLKWNGTSVEMISEFLGHTNTKTTEKYLDSFDDSTKLSHMSALTDF